MINYNDRIFRPVANTVNGESSGETVFHYRQEGKILSAEYSGGRVKKGNLLGLVGEDGSIDIRYQQVNIKDELMTGICHSVPEQLPDGRIRLHEDWQWTSGDNSSGKSVIEEQQGPEIAPGSRD